MRNDLPSTAQARALRAHNARLADLFAERCVDALLDGRYAAAAYWSSAYHVAASRCRGLGALARAEPSLPAATH